MAAETKGDPYALGFKYHIPRNGLADDGSFISLCGLELGRGMDYYRFDSEHTCGRCKRTFQRILKRSAAMAWP